MLDYKPCYASLPLQKPKPCPINCITSSKGELSPVSLRRSPNGNTANYQPSPGSKQGIYCHLVFTGANRVLFDSPPPISFHSVNKETTWKKKKMTLGRLSPVDTVLIWESYCPFEMLKKPVGSWYSSEMKWERQKQNRMLCNAIQGRRPVFEFIKCRTSPTDLILTTETNTKP